MFEYLGRYNITEANEGNELYNQMSKCDTEVKTNCSFTLSADDISNLSTCKAVMENFKLVNLN